MSAALPIDADTVELLSDEELMGLIHGDVVRGVQSRAWTAAARQARIKQASDRLTRRVNRNLDLEPHMRVDAKAFHDWGNAEGYECWEDDSFLREWHRDNPECRVRVEKPMDRVGWTQALERGAQKSGLVLTDSRGNAA